MNNTDNSTIASNLTTNQPKTFTDIVHILHYFFIGFVCLHLIYFVFMLIKINYCRAQEVPEEEAKMRRINEECSICLDTISNETQLLCSHSFCAKCIYDYYDKNFKGSKIKCPYCRKESKLFVTNFNTNESNKEVYQKLIDYNEAMNQELKTSWCLCYDIILFFVFYTKNILNFRNDQYSGQRKCLAVLIIVVILIIISPISGRDDLFEFIGDIIYYVIMILIIVERFSRRIREQIERSNTERRESELNQSNNSGIQQNNNNQNNLTSSQIQARPVNQNVNQV